jgi:cation diffusion facilitator family transporter
MDASARRSPAQTVSQERLMPQEAPPGRPPGLPNLPPPPPPSGGALAWLRWTITVLKASTGGNRAAIRRHHAPTGGSESTGTVAIAISTDLAMAVAKAVAAALTGSAALFAETLHSLADTGNQLLLLKGLRGTRRRPDASHPFGYGAELFYWSLLAALGIFIIGGVLSIWEGAQHLLHPSEIQLTLVGVAVLGLGFLLDGTSWLASVRQLRREATARGVPFRQHLRSTTDTAVTAVYYEDTAALLGNAIALTGLGLHQLLGSPAPDAVAGIVIGLLLAAIGLRLAARNRTLLTNRSDSPVVLDRIRDLLASDPEVATVGQVASVYLGPHQLLVTAEIQPLDAISGLRLRQLLAELRGRVTEAIPRAAFVFLTPVVTVEQQPEPTPWDTDYWLQRFPDHEQA